MWCEMIVPWMGHTKMYFPFAASEFRAADAPLSRQVPQIAAYHNKEPICCQKGLDVVLPRKLTGWGCTWAYIPIQADEGSAADDPLSRQVPQIAAYHNKLLKGYAESDEYPLVEALAIYVALAERVVAR